MYELETAGLKYFNPNIVSKYVKKVTPITTKLIFNQISVVID
jgi:hypothetical protein